MVLMTKKLFSFAYNSEIYIQAEIYSEKTENIPSQKRRKVVPWEKELSSSSD